MSWALPETSDRLVPCVNPEDDPRVTQHWISTLRRAYEIIKDQEGRSVWQIESSDQRLSETQLRHLVKDLVTLDVVQVGEDPDGRKRPLHVNGFDLEAIRWVTVDRVRYLSRLDRDPLGDNGLEDVFHVAGQGAEPWRKTRPSRLKWSKYPDTGESGETYDMERRQ